jgi:rhamnosyltransferase subunit B
LCTLLLTDPGTLISRISLWQSEFASFMPDLIVADYAPSLSMAAAGKVPCFVIGSGYTLPPPELDFCLPVNNQGSYDRETAETVWLEKLNAVLAQSGAGKINYLPQLNQGDGYGLFTIPLFDPYWRQRQQHYLGVYHPDGSPMPSATNDGVVIAYFSKPPESFRILDGLIESGLPTFAHFGVTTDVLRARASNTNVKLVEKPFNLAKDLPGRALTVHTGSLGMSAAGVYAGLPQVGLYHYDEGMGNCRSFDIAQIGSSGWIAKIKPSDIAEMMQKAANSSPMRKYATALSQRYSEFRDSSAVSRAVPLVHQLMG